MVVSAGGAWRAGEASAGLSRSVSPLQALRRGEAAWAAHEARLLRRLRDAVRSPFRGALPTRPPRGRSGGNTAAAGCLLLQRLRIGATRYVPGASRADRACRG